MKLLLIAKCSQILIIVQTNSKKSFKEKPMKSKSKHDILKYKSKLKLKTIITKL